MLTLACEPGDSVKNATKYFFYFCRKKGGNLFFFTCQRVRHIANFSVLLSQTETLSVSFEINLILVACTLFPSRQKNLRTPAHALTSFELLGYHSTFPYHEKYNRRLLFNDERIYLMNANIYNQLYYSSCTVLSSL